ncbi:MAG TPA: DEAD/DEAH box helicase [Gemmatimonadaceae bacterium]|nr:DEAD/DEAH box helicase [Gemmatimonadaceae bacterium]
MNDTTSSSDNSPDSTADGAFLSLGLDPALVAAVASLGYEEPTDIQREAIPPLIAGRDVLGQAATGTGKTAAFALPLLHRIGRFDGDEPAVRGLILVPTRELAMQVAEAVHKYGRQLGIRVLPIYGGQAMQQQLRALKRGVDVVVATPGRALDHIRRRTLRLDAVQMVVLDEADEMLDMGFAEDLDAILGELPEVRQTALFSATMAPAIRAIASRHLKEPELVTIARERVAPGEAPRVREVAYVVQRRHKVPALARVLDMEAPTSAIVFCRTRTEVDELTETLGGRGYRAEALHGGLSQEQRDRVMRRFRDGTSELLVATDVAARGLDIEHVSHVVNFDVPSSPDAYVHRTGRTGRAGREGVAITLAEAREHRLLRNIEQLTKRKISIESVPTVTDLRARRMELTRSSLEELLVGGELDGYRSVVESLAEEYDVLDVAAAAVKLADEAGEPAETNDEEIPNAFVPRRDERPRRDRDREAPRGDRATRAPREERRGEREERPRRGRVRGERSAGGDVARVFVALGRNSGVRPADLVGAIANEAGIDSRSIGAIEIADRFSLVEVPDDAADDVIRALKGTTIRGKKVLARRDRDA